MRHPILRLYEDVLPDGALEIRMPPLPRMIFLVRGVVAIRVPPGGSLAWRRRGGASSRQWRCDLLAIRACAAGCARRRLDRSLGTIVAEGRGFARDAAQGRSSLARRQRRLSAGRLRLSPPPSGAWHPLPDRGGDPYRFTRAFDALQPGRGLVRGRPRSGVRAGGARSSDPLHSSSFCRAISSAKARSNMSTKPTRANLARSSTRSSSTPQSRFGFR
jgi:hypothetical protein